MMTNEYIVVGPIVYATLMAYVEFAGRDRRRIKREVNKAIKRARKQPDADR